MCKFPYLVLTRLKSPKLALSRTNSPTLATAKWIPISMGTIHLIKLQTGPTGGKVVQLKGGPVFSKPFQLDRTDPLSFVPKFPEILVEWIAPNMSSHSQGNFTINPQREDTKK